MGSISPLVLILIVVLSLVAVYLVTLLPERLRLGAIIVLLVVIVLVILLLVGIV